MLIVDGRRSLYPAIPGISDDPDFTAALAAMGPLDQMAAEVPVRRRGRRRARTSGTTRRSRSFATRPSARRAGARSSTSRRERSGARDPEELSLLYCLFYVAAAGNPTTPGSFVRLFTTAGGGQESRFVGGSQRVPNAVARRLGDRVVLEAPVRRIETSGSDRVTVLADGVEVAARRVVVAVPPILAARIDFAPALPAAKRKLLRKMAPGTTLKLEATYDRPWWRDLASAGRRTAPSTRSTRRSTTRRRRARRASSSGSWSETPHARSRLGGRRARPPTSTPWSTCFGEEARNVTGFVQRDWTREPVDARVPGRHLGPQPARPRWVRSCASPWA